MKTIHYKEYLPLLVELQELDTSIQAMDMELRSIPEKVETSGSEYLTLVRNIQEKEARLNAITQERQGLEESLKTDTALIEAREQRLYALKTQKEYQATLKEVAQLKKENKDRENRILSLLEEGEKIVKENTQLKSMSADKEGEYRQMEEGLKKRMQELEAEVAVMHRRRPEILKGLPAPVLKKYEVIKQRFTVAIAAVKRGICQGCHMNVPSQFYNEMLKGTELRNCPNCHRLIYPGLEESKQEA